MNLLDLQPSERLVEILHPSTGEEIGIRVSLISLDDEKLKKIKRKIRDNAINLQKRGKTMSVEEEENNEIALLETCITDWDWYGDVTLNGEKPEKNLKNIKEVYNKLPWFTKQINTVLGDEQGFFPS